MKVLLFADPADLTGDADVMFRILQKSSIPVMAGRYMLAAARGEDFLNEELTIADFVEWCAEGLRAAGVDAPPLLVYSLRPCEPGLVFGFTAFSPAQIRSAMQSLSKLFQ